MPKKTGLGKGLDALFGPTPEEEQIKEDDVLKNLKITEVEPNRDQPRKNFKQEALEELAESIKEYGFGFDDIFELEDGRTLAELSDKEKNEISARKKALEKLKNM